MNQSLVSIIIPYYNLPEFVDEAVESALGQTYKNIEIILVNDGSTQERALKKLAQLKTTYKNKIRFIDQENKGVASARNIGIKRAHGTYIVCLDSDDWLDREYITKTIPLLQTDNRLGFVTTWYRLFGEADTVIRAWDYSPRKLLAGNRMHDSSIFTIEAWKRINGFNEALLNSHEDWDFWLRMVYVGKYRWTVVPETLFNYRIRPASRCSSNISRQPWYFLALIKYNPKIYKAHMVAFVSSLGLLIGEMLIRRLKSYFFLKK